MKIKPKRNFFILLKFVYVYRDVFGSFKELIIYQPQDQQQFLFYLEHVNFEDHNIRVFTCNYFVINCIQYTDENDYWYSKFIVDR